MVDLSNTEKGRFVIEGPDGTDMVVNPGDGSINTTNIVETAIEGTGDAFLGETDITAGATVQVLSEQVPSGKTWFLKSWIMSGEEDGFYQLQTIDLSGVSETLREDFEATTGWAVGGDVLSVATTTDNTEGTNALKSDLDFEGKGNQDGTITKTISPTQNWSAEALILIDAKSDLSNVEMVLTITQGGASHVFAAQALTTSYQEFQYSISEITEHDSTAIDEIEIEFVETGKLRVDGFAFTDNLRTADSVGDQRVLDEGYMSPQHHTIRFDPHKKVVGGDDVFIRAIATNNGGATGGFTVAIQGSEIDT